MVWFAPSTTRVAHCSKFHRNIIGSYAYITNNEVKRIWFVISKFDVVRWLDALKWILFIFFWATSPCDVIFNASTFYTAIFHGNFNFYSLRCNEQIFVFNVLQFAINFTIVQSMFGQKFNSTKRFAIYSLSMGSGRGAEYGSTNRSLTCGISQQYQPHNKKFD